MYRTTAIAGALLAVCGLPAGAAAQSLGDVIKRSAEREVKRQADRRTREAVQCVTGARDCTPDEAQGAPRQAATPAPTPANPATGAEAYLVPSGAAGAPAAAPFSPPVPAGGRVVSNEVADGASYLRITGFAGSRVVTQAHTGRLTRTEYQVGGEPTAIVGAIRAELERQGFVIEWDCTRRQACGSTALHDGGRGWNGVNGLNLGVASNMRYLTARLDREGRPAVYVSAGANPNVAHVHTLELAR